MSKYFLDNEGWEKTSGDMLKDGWALAVIAVNQDWRNLKSAHDKLQSQKDLALKHAEKLAEELESFRMWNTETHAQAIEREKESQHKCYYFGDKVRKWMRYALDWQHKKFMNRAEKALESYRKDFPKEDAE